MEDDNDASYFSVYECSQEDDSAKSGGEKTLTCTAPSCKKEFLNTEKGCS